MPLWLYTVYDRQVPSPPGDHLANLFVGIASPVWSGNFVDYRHISWTLCFNFVQFNVIGTEGIIILGELWPHKCFQKLFNF